MKGPPCTMAFDLQPNLRGDLIELRPLTLEDWGGLFAVASDPLIWEQHPESDRYKKDVFKIFFSDALASGGAFVIIDQKKQQIIGSTRFFGYDPKKSEVELDGRSWHEGIGAVITTGN